MIESGRGRSGRVARDVQRAGEFAFGDGQRAEGHLKFVGYLLGGERSPRPEEATSASQGDDGASRPRLRPAVADDAEAGGVGKHLPSGLGVGPSESARTPGGGQGGGALAGRSMVAQRRWLGAHWLEYRRRPEAIGAQLNPCTPRRRSASLKSGNQALSRLSSAAPLIEVRSISIT